MNNKGKVILVSKKAAEAAAKERDKRRQNGVPMSLCAIVSEAVLKVCGGNE